MTDAEYAAKLEKAHVALLLTLAASHNRWIRMVYQNANAYYQTLQGERNEGNRVDEAEGVQSQAGS